MEFPCHPGRRLVARGEAATIEECACGTLHVTLGALTVRLRPEIVASLWETLGEALDVVDRRPTGGATPVARHRPERPS